MGSKKGKTNIPVLVICVVLFVVCFILQGRISGGAAAAQQGAAQAAQGGAQGGPSAGAGLTQAFNGVIAQVQLVLSVLMVLFSGKVGFITATACNALNAVYVLVLHVIIKHNMNSLPGAIVSLIGIGIIALIYFYISKTSKMNDELMESYQQAIENNRIMKEKDDTLQYLAYYDRLTQMPNRQMFIETLEDNIKEGDSCTIVYVDIDNFRNINDNWGHTVGDDLLVRYSHKIENYCGDDYFAAKIGGDEYGIIMPSSYTTEDIVKFVEGLMEIFGTAVDIKGDVFQLTASYGAASFPNDARSSEDLFRCAETAMFNAKSNGKNQLCFYRRAF